MAAESAHCLCIVAGALFAWAWVRGPSRRRVPYSLLIGRNRRRAEVHSQDCPELRFFLESMSLSTGAAYGGLITASRLGSGRIGSAYAAPNDRSRLT